MRGRLGLFVSILCFGLAMGIARADVKLPALFSEGMVLQQGRPCPVWGWAEDGEKVTVRFRGQEASTVAKGGKWRVTLAQTDAGGPFPMTVAGKNTLELKQVFVGEVWVCSGQSNMQFSLRGAFEAQKEIDASANPQLHLFTVPNVKATAPLDDVQAQWVEAGPTTTPGFSAVAYYFGRDLQRALKVPVGLIHTSWGGSPAEVWMSDRVISGDAEYRRLAEAATVGLANYREAMAKFALDLPKVRAQARKIVTDADARAKALVEAAKGKSADEVTAANEQALKIKRDARTRAGQLSGGPRRPWVPCELYNGMIAPLIPFAIRGAIWYQGESNAGRAYQYRRLYADMIRNWREDWGQGDFPFLCVQLAPFMKIKEQPGESAWAELREAQLLSTKLLPNAGMAVITDVGEEDNIHPKHKEPVGARLAIAALGIAYKQTKLYSGPVYRSMRVRGNKAVLSFDFVGAGLEARGGELKGFCICGPDKRFVWAKAEIQGNTVVVSSPEVARPVAVRYGWADYPVVNFWNKDGLPATPFRTDDFPMLTGPKAK